MTELSFPIAFLAGIISFLAPCVVPLLPAYVGYVTGVSLEELKKHGYARYRKQMIASSVLYILGFATVFTILGTAAAGLGGTIRGNGGAIQVVGGAVMVVLGLQFAGIFHIKALSMEKKFALPAWADKLGHARSFFIGIIFAIAWSPCVGAVLGSILALAAASGTAATGASLLFVYSLGISLPFLLISMTLAQAPKYLKTFNRYAGGLSKAAGAIIAVLGVLLITGSYGHVNAFFYSLFGWGDTLTNLL